MGDRHGLAPRYLRTLFEAGVVGSLTDAELLARIGSRLNESRECAFATLVERHGPMVLGVCRAVIHDEHEAEDALQATFLVLARRAGSLRVRNSLGPWLHEVACRVASRARASAGRRRRHERRAAEMRTQTVTDVHEDDTERVLHEEIDRLPATYRVPVVLCYLEGLTSEQAALQLGWPVGTVRSRLARGKDRLRGRLIRRGVAPEQATDSRLAQTVVMPAAMTQVTVQAVSDFAAGRSIAGLVSTFTLSLALRTLRTMQMTRLAIISGTLILGLVATCAAVLTTQEQEPARQSLPARKASGQTDPARPSPPSKKVEMVNVRVVDLRNRGVPNVDVEIIQRELDREGSRYRTGVDGRVRIPIDPYASPGSGTQFLARPDVQTLGWAYRPPPPQKKGSDDNPIPLVLLPRSQIVEGSVVDTAGKPIGGVQIRVGQIENETNQWITDMGCPEEASLLGATVTDPAGRYALRLPEKSRASLFAFHPRYNGPGIDCSPDARVIAPVTLDDAGGVVGKVVDAATGQPVQGARVGANAIEADGRDNIGAGRAISDARGLYRIGGLAIGVYNLCLETSPRGNQFTAQAVEGVRVSAGEEASVDLELVKGRRVQGTVVDATTGKPMSGVSMLCISTALPSSGNAGRQVDTDEQGHFEFFVPAGLAYVYVRDGDPHSSPFVEGPHLRTLHISADRDPEPLLFTRGAGVANPSPKLLASHEVQLRVTAKVVNAPVRAGASTVIGRIFDQDGSPVPGVQVDYNDRKTGRTFTFATDRQGVFRLRGIPADPSLLSFHKLGFQPVGAKIPPEALEVELTLQRRPKPPE